MSTKRAVRGRQALALVTSLDAWLLVTSALLVLTALDDPEFYDLLLWAGHFAHALTVPLGYVVVRYASNVPDTLRALVVFYLIATVMDIVVLIGRIILGLHNVEILATLAQIIVAIGFLLIDVVGAFFANLAQAYAMSFRYTDEQLVASAAAVLRQREESA